MCKVTMEIDESFMSLSLLHLPSSTRKLLSDLLNSIKVIQIETPRKLPRDWRGIAALANISSEVVNSFEDDYDKITRVLNVWSRDQAPTIGLFLEHLQTLDRFDVYDDVIADLRDHWKREDLLNNSVSSSISDDDLELITSEDRPDHKHQYDAYILYSPADTGFILEMKQRLPEFEFCTKENLLPGHMTMYKPIVKLMTDRCRYIVAVYSPDFFNDKDLEFYRDYAHAHNIKSQRKLIPVMYRKCTLPRHLDNVFMLYLDNLMYDFWDKLMVTLNSGRDVPVITSPRKESKKNGVASVPWTVPTPAVTAPPVAMSPVTLSPTSLPAVPSTPLPALESDEKPIKNSKTTNLLCYIAKKFNKKKKKKDFKNELILNS